MKVIAKDLDGEKNGIYQSDSIEISFSDKDLIKRVAEAGMMGRLKRQGKISN